MLLAYSLMKESSSSTGTGNLVLDGAMEGFKAFSDDLGDNVYFPYVIKSATEFETGIGYLSSGSLVRAYPAEGRSEFGSASLPVSFGAGAKEVYCAAGGANSYPAGRQNLFGSTTPPTQGHGSGYHLGSLSFSSNGEVVYICVDGGAPGDANTGKWRLLAHEQIGMLFDSMGGRNWYFGAQVPVVDNIASGILPGDAVVLGGGTKALARVEYHGSVVQPFANADAFAGGHQKADFGCALTTTSATPAVLTLGGDYPDNFKIAPDSALLVEVGVVAFDLVTNDCACWKVKFGVSRAGTANPALIGTPTIELIGESAGAAAWDVTVAINTTKKSADVTVTGASGKTIRWTASFETTRVAFS